MTMPAHEQARLDPARAGDRPCCDDAVCCDDSARVRDLASEIRRAVVEMTHRARSSHLGSALSAADLIAALYSGILRIDPAAPAAPGRDRFILSKGHACAALYAALASRGFFPTSWLSEFYQDGAPLAGHATHKGVPGVEVSTGSLGHGLPIACGLALAAKKDAAPYRVFVLLSDGECDEGSVWEAALFAAHHALDNLVAIVDYNKIQSLGSVREILGLEPFAEKWKSFGWSVTEINGHDLSQIGAALDRVPREPGRPACVVAHTVKGRGIGFMENNLLWHYRAPDAAERDQALAELDAGIAAPDQEVAALDQTIRDRNEAMAELVEPGREEARR
jgi:transketolase